MLSMLSPYRLLTRFRFCVSYNQKNHKKDFTANRLNEKFLHLHLDYLEMDPKNFDERLLINIYIKSINDNIEDLAKRTLRFTIQNLHRIENLMTITNLLREATHLYSNEQLRAVYARGLKIIETNMKVDQNDINSTFKNFDSGSISSFVSYLLNSPMSDILNQPQNYQIIKDISFVLGPFYSTLLIQEAHKTGFEKYVNLFCDHMFSLRSICCKQDIESIRLINSSVKNLKLRNMVERYRGSQHRKEFSSA